MPRGRFLGCQVRGYATELLDAFNARRDKKHSRRPYTKPLVVQSKLIAVRVGIELAEDGRAIGEGIALPHALAGHDSHRASVNLQEEVCPGGGAVGPHHAQPEYRVGRYLHLRLATMPLDRHRPGHGEAGLARRLGTGGQDVLEGYERYVAPPPALYLQVYEEAGHRESVVEVFAGVGTIAGTPVGRPNRRAIPMGIRPAIPHPPPKQHFHRNNPAPTRTCGIGTPPAQPDLGRELCCIPLKEGD